MRDFISRKNLTDVAKAQSSKRDTASFWEKTSIPIESAVLVRKASCPCDGGCPRCRGIIQPKLKIGVQNDVYEQEADRVADEVMRMPDIAISNQLFAFSKGNNSAIQRKPG